MLWVSLFLDLIGFGMAFPDVQLRAESLGAPGWAIGAILAALFLVQLVVSPLWGRWSDRVGRKTPLVLCTLLSAASMAVYATADNLWWIAASRMLAGLGAANVSIAQALVADVTEENGRASALGRLGAAVMAGITLGPGLGGWISQAYGSAALGWTAASLSLLAAILLLLALPASSVTAAREPGKRPIFDFRLLREESSLRPLFLLAVVGWFALACLEGTFGRLLENRYTWPNSLLGLPFEKPVGAFGFIFSIESLVGVAVQGLLMARIEKAWDLRTRLRIGYFLQGAGLLLTPFAPGLGVILLFSATYSAGIAVANPSVNAACSTLVSAQRQGELFGLLQGARAIGYILGPILGGALFDLEPASPYVLAGLIGLAAAVLAGRLARDERPAPVNAPA